MLLDLMSKRRSIRAFTEQKLNDSQLEYLRETAVRAPTSRGLNPWRFDFVSDTDIIAKLAQAKTKGSAFLAGAALAVVVSADSQRSDVWIEDCSIAAICLQLAAVELGLGSCWAQIRRRENSTGISAGAYIANILDLPENQEVVCVIGIGYPAEDKPPHSRDDLPWEHIVER